MAWCRECDLELDVIPLMHHVQERHPQLWAEVMDDVWRYIELEMTGDIIELPPDEG